MPNTHTCEIFGLLENARAALFLVANSPIHSTDKPNLQAQHTLAIKITDDALAIVATLTAKARGLAEAP